MPAIPRYEHGSHRLWSLLEGMPTALHRVELWPTSGDPPTGGGREPHFHSVPTVVACLDGVVRTCGGTGRRLDLHTGVMLVIAPGVWHVHEPLRAGSAGFEQGFLAACSDLKVHDHQRDLVGRIPVEPCRLIIDRLVALGAGAEAATARRAAGRELFRQILGETIEPLEPPHPALRRMLDVLWSRLHEPITTADLVAASGLGRSQAHALYSAYFGEGLAAGLRRLRLELARALLAEGLPVGEVARRCGFPSRANLTRGCNRAYRAPPRRLRAGLSPATGSR